MSVSLTEPRLRLASLSWLLQLSEFNWRGRPADVAGFRSKSKIQPWRPSSEMAVGGFEPTAVALPFVVDVMMFDLIHRVNGLR